jgi:hypothetical protein
LAFLLTSKLWYKSLCWTDLWPAKSHVRFVESAPIECGGSHPIVLPATNTQPEPLVDWEMVRAALEWSKYQIHVKLGDSDHLRVLPHVCSRFANRIAILDLPGYCMQLLWKRGDLSTLAITGYTTSFDLVQKVVARLKVYFHLAAQRESSSIVSREPSLPVLGQDRTGDSLRDFWIPGEAATRQNYDQEQITNKMWFTLSSCLQSDTVALCWEQAATQMRWFRWREKKKESRILVSSKIHKPIDLCWMATPTLAIAKGWKENGHQNFWSYRYSRSDY